MPTRAHNPPTPPPALGPPPPKPPTPTRPPRGDPDSRTVARPPTPPPRPRPPPRRPPPPPDILTGPRAVPPTPSDTSDARAAVHWWPFSSPRPLAAVDAANVPGPSRWLRETAPGKPTRASTVLRISYHPGGRSVATAAMLDSVSTRPDPPVDSPNARISMKRNLDPSRTAPALSCISQKNVDPPRTPRRLPQPAAPTLQDPPAAHYRSRRSMVTTTSPRCLNARRLTTGGAAATVIPPLLRGQTTADRRPAGSEGLAPTPHPTRRAAHPSESKDSPPRGGESTRGRDLGPGPELDSVIDQRLVSASYTDKPRMGREIKAHPASTSASHRDARSPAHLPSNTA